MGVLAIIGLYIWDDALFAAPVIGAVALWGPLMGWLVCSVVYSAGSLAVSLLLVRPRERPRQGRSQTITRWVTGTTDRRSAAWMRGALASGAVLGFIASSVLLGGIATTWLTHRLVPDRPVTSTAVAACSIFGFTFCALYSGVASIAL